MLLFPLTGRGVARLPSKMMMSSLATRRAETRMTWKMRAGPKGREREESSLKLLCLLQKAQRTKLLKGYGLVV